MNRAEVRGIIPSRALPLVLPVYRQALPRARVAGVGIVGILPLTSRACCGVSVVSFRAGRYGESSSRRKPSETASQRPLRASPRARALGAEAAAMGVSRRGHPLARARWGTPEMQEIDLELPAYMVPRLPPRARSVAGGAWTFKGPPFQVMRLRVSAECPARKAERDKRVDRAARSACSRPLRAIYERSRVATSSACLSFLSGSLVNPSSRTHNLAREHQDSSREQGSRGYTNTPQEIA